MQIKKNVKESRHPKENSHIRTDKSKTETNVAEVEYRQFLCLLRYTANTWKRFTYENAFLPLPISFYLIAAFLHRGNHFIVFYLLFHIKTMTNARKRTKNIYCPIAWPNWITKKIDNSKEYKESRFYSYCLRNAPELNTTIFSLSLFGTNFFFRWTHSVGFLSQYNTMCRTSWETDRFIITETKL